MCFSFGLPILQRLEIILVTNIEFLLFVPAVCGCEGSLKMDVFRKKPDPKGIEREVGSLQLEEKKLVAEIKKTAKTGNEAATKILAVQLIRLRQQITKLQGSRAQLRGVATHTKAMHATTTVAGAMKGATKVMTAVNQQMDPAKQIKVMQDFQKHSAQMDMTTEMISDSIDGALDDDELEDETDDLTNQVLDEIGIDVAAQMSSAPKGKIGRKTRAEDAGSSGVDDLEQRMSTLRNS
ncbi:hypothetical protein CY35_10G091500 [Sphagnum magellanicum]|nr:hypothetical protein CY35_10G091500 [Sphagnum magellanicum]